MTTTYKDIRKTYGQYRMKLSPNIKLDKHGNLIEAESKANITMYDIGQKFDLLWSKSFPIKEAHAAMTIFESIGFYPMPQ
jgi:hypothetical protein